MKTTIILFFSLFIIIESSFGQFEKSKSVDSAIKRDLVISNNPYSNLKIDTSIIVRWGKSNY